MENWRFNTNRISKYDPSFRNENGAYLKHEWTSFDDIGEEFSGVVLTLEDYLAVESKYIEAINIFLRSIECDEVNVERLEIYTPQGLDDKLLELYNRISEGVKLKGTDVEGIVKLILRENLWCELFSCKDKDYVIRFGYDYYLYFNGGKLKESMFEDIRGLGLFVEN